MSGPDEPPTTALPPGVRPPERAEFDGFGLRRPTPADDEALNEMVKATFDELHPWMPWAAEPVRIEDQRAWIERALTNWVEQEAFHWFIVESQDGVEKLIGVISLMNRIGPGGLEIGYWLRTGATGRGVMTRAAAWLTNTALALPGIERVEIHCDAANVRSAAVPRRLGYRLDRQEAAEPQAPGDSGLDQFWITP
ncbi:MAG: GNAT family N-acetyltransferase [Catenulispora sp.]